jgi:hypothetical protein
MADPVDLCGRARYRADAVHASLYCIPGGRLFDSPLEREVLSHTTMFTWPSLQSISAAGSGESYAAGEFWSSFAFGGRSTSAHPGVRPPAIPCCHARAVFPAPHFRSIPSASFGFPTSTDCAGGCFYPQTAPTRAVADRNVRLTSLVTRAIAPSSNKSFRPIGRKPAELI